MARNRFGRRSMVLGVPGVLAAKQRVREVRKEKEEEEVSPAEDLMREHGVLKRALLVYGECASRLESGKEFPPAAVTGTANLIRKFIEDYHEKLEEEYLFPRLRRAGQLVDLVVVLEAQHKAGRQRRTWRSRSGPSSACMSLTRPGRTRCCFPRSVRSCRRTSTIRSARTSRSESTSSSVRTGFRRSLRKLLVSKKASASTI